MPAAKSAVRFVRYSSSGTDYGVLVVDIGSELNPET
jgi:hypothetical protein